VCSSDLEIAKYLGISSFESLKNKDPDAQ